MAFSSGLPLSLQIGGRRYDDGAVLQVGRIGETGPGTRGRRPDFAASAATVGIITQKRRPSLDSN